MTSTPSIGEIASTGGHTLPPWPVFETLIHHARVGGCAFAQAQVAIPIAVIRAAQRRCLMARPACCFCAVRAGERHMSSQ
jgi:hypothetical protein